MHSILQNVVSELDQIATAVNSGIPNDEPFSIAHNNWSFPGITRRELVATVESLSKLIRERGSDDLGAHDGQIADYGRRLQFLRSHTVPQIWGSAAAAVPTFLHTLDGLRQAVEPVLVTDAGTAGDTVKLTARIRTRATALEARLNEVEPRSAKLIDMVTRIEHAYDAADQLPADLEQLAQDRARMAELLKDAESDRVSTAAARETATKHSADLASRLNEAETILKQCHLAYAAATSQGLAAAFTARSKALDISMWIWVGGFVAALAFGAFVGSQRLHELSELMKNPSLTIGTAILNLLLAALSLGAPIWFGWLANKQIGQRFRLSEDYAFKASVSSAYEGYRREAARFDKDMEARLLSSALTRLDEQPLRFVEANSHGSPWHELASSDLIKSAMNSVPGFTEIVRESARDALGALKSVAPAAKDSTRSQLNDSNSPVS